MAGGKNKKFCHEKEPKSLNFFFFFLLIFIFSLPVTFNYIFFFFFWYIKTIKNILKQTKIKSFNQLQKITKNRKENNKITFTFKSITYVNSYNKFKSHFYLFCLFLFFLFFNFILHLYQLLFFHFPLTSLLTHTELETKSFPAE